jgi:hypothetical protein
MKICLLPIIALTALAISAQAGPHAGGVVVVHATPPIFQTVVEHDGYCGWSDPSGGCPSLDTNLPGAQGFGFWVWWVAAAFPEEAEPRLTGVEFGIDYDPDTVFLVDHDPCGDSYQPTGDWPSPGSGTKVTWIEPQTSIITEAYWFAGYEYYGIDTAFCVIPHPTLGGDFSDDSIPPELDPIADYGCLGFNGDPGYLPCPTSPSGACCLSDDSCEQLTESICSEMGGTYIGDGVPCEPDPCEAPTDTERTTWGRLKSSRW